MKQTSVDQLPRDPRRFVDRVEALMLDKQIESLVSKKEGDDAQTAKKAEDKTSSKANQKKIMWSLKRRIRKLDKALSGKPKNEEPETVAAFEKDQDVKREERKKLAAELESEEAAFRLSHPKTVVKPVAPVEKAEVKTAEEKKKRPKKEKKSARNSGPVSPSYKQAELPPVHGDGFADGADEVKLDFSESKETKKQQKKRKALDQREGLPINGFSGVTAKKRKSVKEKAKIEA